MSGTSLDLDHPVLGTAWFAADDPGAAAGSIEAYLDAGGRVIDTARIYGDSEDVLGGWLRDHGDVPGLRLLTKGGHPDPAGWVPRLGRDAVLGDARTSVAKLGCPVELFLLHRDDPGAHVEDVADTLRAMADEGLTSRVGVSNWSLNRTIGLRDALEDRGLALGAISSYAGLALASGAPDWRGEVSLDPVTLGWAEEAGIPELAWSSQSSGFFVGAYRGGQFEGVENVRRRAVLDEIAAVAGVPAPSVLARWSATISPVVVPVVASRSPDRVTRTLADMRDPSLDAAVGMLLAALDPTGVLGRSLIEPGAAW